MTMEQDRRHERVIFDNRSSHPLYESIEHAYDAYLQYWDGECKSYFVTCGDFLFYVKTNKNSITIQIYDRKD